MLDLFDCNVMLGKIKTPMPGGILDCARLLEEMDRYKISEALVTHALSKRHDPARGNALLDEAVSQSNRLHPCWMLLPTETGELPPLPELAEAMRAARVRAVRIAPDAGNHLFSLAPVVCGPLFGWLQELRIPLFVELNAVSWEHIDRISDAFPQLRLVLLDTNYRVNRDLYPRLKVYGGLYIDTSGVMQHCGLQDLCERFGPDRLLFGSRLPLLCAGAAIHALECAPIPPEAKTAIAGTNLRKLLSQVLL